MANEQNVQRILDYLRQEQGLYSADALREQLLASGYRSDDIDEAFTRLQEPATPAAQTGATILLPPEDAPAAQTGATIVLPPEDMPAAQPDAPMTPIVPQPPDDR